MTKLPPIKTPLVQHLRRIRYQMVPVVTFCVVVLLTGWLWRRHRQLPGLVGEVEAIRVAVRSQYDGLLVPLDSGPLEVFDDVQAGQAVARLDDGPAQAALAALKKEVEKLQDELRAAAARYEQEEADRRYSRFNETRRLAVDVERARLARLGLLADLQRYRVRLNRLTKLLGEAVKARQAGGESFQAVVDLTLQRDEVQARIQGTQQALKQAEADLKSAEERLKAHPSARPADLEALLEPFRKARAAQEARVRELELQIAAMSIRSPISGKVCAILRHPGEAVRAGEDILVIAAGRGRHIITYVRQYERFRPQVGMPVIVRPRSGPARTLKSHVARVGPQVEEVPPHQRLDPARLEWGLPVLIALPPGANLRPGELVDIAFKTG